MKHPRMKRQGIIRACAAGLFIVLLALPVQISSFAGQKTPPSPGTLPIGPARFRADIQTVESSLSKIADRGAAQFFLAWLYMHVNEVQKALALLKQCPLNEGFDPGGADGFDALAANPEFRELVARVHRRYPPVHRAHVVFNIPEKDLFPEGLAADVERHIFYMGSMHLKKIIAIDETGKVSDFVPPGLYDLMPVGGVHVNPADHSVWAVTDPGVKNQSELLHFDAHGKLLERYVAPGSGPHDLNDFVLRADEIYVTDTFANQVYRFDCRTHTFSPLTFPRPIFYPNGITLSGDGNFLYAADMLGVIRVDLRNNAAREVITGQHFTIAGIDGLYWYQSSLIGEQYGAGAYRVARWKLAPDGLHVVSAEMLEYRTPLVKDPTTGAIVGTKFYFISNTGIDNLGDDDKIIDPHKLEDIHVSVVSLK